MYLPVPAEPKQLEENLTNCGEVHTAALKVWVYFDRRSAHSQLEKVLYLVK